MKKNIQIVFADDKELFRNAILRELLDYNIDCIGEAANGLDLLEKLSVLKPDVVLLDLEMPVMNGNEAMEAISRLYPKTKIIILSLHNDELLVEDYIKRGVKGYLAKDEISGNVKLLAEAIDKVHKGKTFISRPHTGNEPKLLKGRGYTLKQKEIIPMICEGMTNKEIAREMGILERSVEKQRKKIYQKTNSFKSIDFFKYAFVKGLQFLGKRMHQR